jgi:predicted ArsR family transcriptional regulator
MAKLEIPQLPVEMAHQQAGASWGGIYAAAIRALVDKFGSKEALKILHPYLKEMGKETGAMAEMLGFTSKDAIAIASLIHLFEKQMLLVKGEPTEVSPNRVVKEITECPFQSFAPEFCLAFLSVCEGICQAINPDYKWTLPKFIPKGDPICQWIVEKK